MFKVTAASIVVETEDDEDKQSIGSEKSSCEEHLISSKSSLISHQLSPPASASHSSADVVTIDVGDLEGSEAASDGVCC